jgi:1-deoxy-D-xylulose-5-phosphate synthase
MKKLDYSKLKKEAAEIRKMIIKRASENSGHCASPLGVVELTQALLAVFDFKKDKIVFDVGHQAHAYKILTGRKDSYYSMSKKGGMRAYPDISESKYDFYGVGHTSTSISAALGYSIGHPEYKSVAVVGDGSLTGGETFEGMNHAGALRTNILVIYNDNGMSLVENVGALHDKKNVKGFAESLGFEYIGVEDGHDTKKLVEILEAIKQKSTPVFLHLSTIKGKGYEYAEKEPSRFHWPAPFDIKTGKPKSAATGDSWFAHNHKKAIEYLKKHKNLFFTTPALVGWGLGGAKAEFPDRVIDTGINEQHCVTFSSALALSGNKVLCYIPSTFLARAFDQVIDVCLQKIPMVFVITFPGIADGGYTHQGIYTFPMLNMLPTATIMHPSGFDEFDRMLDVALKSGKTVFIQSPKENIKAPAFNGSITQVKKGNKLTVLPLGNMFTKALKLANTLQEVEVLYSPIIKPFDSKALSSYVKKTGKLLILEDSFVRSGIGEGIVRDLYEMGVKFDYSILGVRDIFPEQGSMEDVYEYVGLSDSNICEVAEKLIKRV